MDDDFKLLDCDSHCYEPRDVVHPVPAEGVPRPGHPPDRQRRRRRGHPGRRPGDDDEQRAGHRLRQRLPARLAQGDAPADGFGQSRRDLPAPADAAGVPRARRPRAVHGREQGVERCVLFPAGMAMGAEHYVADTDALYVNLMSFNRWYDETWGFNGPTRSTPPPLLSLRDLDRAVELTDDILERGAKVVLHPDRPTPTVARPATRTSIRSGPGSTRPASPWRCTSGRLVLRRDLARTGGMDPDPGSWHMSAWQWMNVMGERAAIDTSRALIFDNLFGRFPNLRAARRRARRQLGSAHARPHGQEPRHGSQRTVDRRRA